MFSLNCRLSKWYFFWPAAGHEKTSDFEISWTLDLGLSEYSVWILLMGIATSSPRNHRTYTMSCTFTRLLEHSSLRMESNFLNISFYKGIWRYFCKRKKKKRKSGKKSSKRKQKRQRSPAPEIDLTNIWVSYRAYVQHRDPCTTAPTVHNFDWTSFYLRVREQQQGKSI